MARCEVGGTHSGRKPSGNRQYEITRVQDKHREIMRLIVLGMKNTEIAERLNVSTATVTAVKNSSLTRRQIEYMQEERNQKVTTPAERLEKLVIPSIDALEDILKNDESSMKIKKETAIAILDRNGFGPTKKIEGKHAVAVFNEHDYEELKRRREAAIEEGVLVQEVEEEEQ